MVKADYCRSNINKRIGRIRRMFRWAVEKVAEMRRVSAGVNARFLAVLAYPDERLSSGRSPREERVLEGLTGAGIAVCDLFDTFRRERDAGAALFVDEGHWSAAGHRLAAAEIARELSERGWLPE